MNNLPNTGSFSDKNGTEYLLANHNNIIAENHMLARDKEYLLLMILDRLVVSFMGTISSCCDDDGFITIGFNPIHQSRKVTVKDNPFMHDAHSKWFIIDPDYKGEDLNVLGDALDFSNI